jgi:hypothetical protein
MYCCCIDDTNSILWYQSFQLVLNMASFESPIYPYIEGIVIKLLLHCNGEVFVSNICRAQNYGRSVLIHFSIKVFKRNQATNLSLRKDSGINGSKNIFEEVNAGVEREESATKQQLRKISLRRIWKIQRKDLELGIR